MSRNARSRRYKARNLGRRLKVTWVTWTPDVDPAGSAWPSKSTDGIRADIRRLVEEWHGQMRAAMDATAIVPWRG